MFKLLSVPKERLKWDTRQNQRDPGEAMESPVVVKSRPRVKLAPPPSNQGTLTEASNHSKPQSLHYKLRLNGTRHVKCYTQCDPF